MANYKKKENNESNKNTEVNNNTNVEKNNSSVTENTKVESNEDNSNVETEEVKVTQPRVFKQDDLIPCRSLVSGALYIEGIRSKVLYSWADCDDVVDVEYRDLIYMVRTREDKSIYEPRIIIEDEDFISQNKSVKDLYDSMYTIDSLRGMLSMSPEQILSEIPKLPIGAKNALKGIASTMIASHQLDSIHTIKALDEVFGTNMLLTLVQE